MNKRIERLVKAALETDLYPECVGIEWDPFDDRLAEPVRIAKRLSDYMLAQKIVLSDDSNLIGLMKFDRSPVPADIFPRNGHSGFREVSGHCYRKPQENLCTFEWQHSNANFGRVIRFGLRGMIDEINAARRKYAGCRERLFFLAGLEMMVQGIGRRVEQYRDFCRKQADQSRDEARRKLLLRMAENLEQVPMGPARTFEQAVQALCICFMFLSDSIGRPDQYLYELYRCDRDSGILTREHAVELLQELFVVIYAHTPHSSPWSDRGAESHFVVGGTTPEGEDGFNELSGLIVEALMELPLVRPQISLRWNRNTPRDVLRRMMDWERRDRGRRIAFVNDEPRIAALTGRCGFPLEVARDYIMVGCNEPAFQGGISLGGNAVNIVRPLLDTLNGRRSEVLACADFEAFYTLFEKELFKALERILEYSNRFNVLRSIDCNVLSSLFLDGCIERAESATRGGAKLALCCADLMGGVTVIDSLCVIRQFVYEEKRVGWPELLAALDNNWNGAEQLHRTIRREARFFGNHDEFSDEMARRFHRSLSRFADGRLDLFGTPLLYGNLTGYHPHFEWFGAETGATPDGRFAGSALTFGSGQTAGRDHDGITSHLLSVAEMDPAGILCGNTVMNLTVDRESVTNEECFEKLVLLVETYFRAGGLHLQLNHVSREELLAARRDPEAYRNLRVRVSGFSACFVTLEEGIQENVIERTVQEVR